MRVLKDYGCIKPFRLTEIMRQETPEYRAAAKLLSEGKTVEGLEAIERLGWIREMSDEDRYSHIAADYLQALDDLKALPENKRVLVVSPTHAEAARITGDIRSGAAGRRKAGWGGSRVYPAGGGGYQRSRTRAGHHLPAGRRAAVPPERQGASKKASGSPSPIRRRCRCRKRHASRSTGRRPSHWPRATASGSPAR